MANKVSLTVNNVPINLDYFVSEYIESIVGGIIASLNDTGEIDDLCLMLDNEGQVTITLNNSDVPLKYFPMEIIKSTLEGMVAPLKGVDGVVSTLEITVRK
jgi:hypothetical protein